MLNVEEKGPVPQNGHGLSNGIVNNKDSENTWDELDSAIDNELNSCSDDVDEEVNKSSEGNEIQPVKSGNASASAEAGLSSLKNNLKSKSSCDIIELDDNETSSNTNANMEKEETVTDELLNENIGSQKVSTDEDQLTCKITTNGIKINLSKANIEKEKNNSQTNKKNSNPSIPNDPKNSPHKSKTSISLNLNKSNISQETISAKPQEKDNIHINDKSRSIKINPNSTKPNPDDESSKKGDNSHVSESANINRKEEQKMLSNTSENNRSKSASKTTKDDTTSEIECVGDTNYDIALRKLSDINQHARVLDDDYVPSSNQGPSSSTCSGEENKKRKSGEMSVDATSSKRQKTSIQDLKTEPKLECKEESKIEAEQAATKAIKKQLKRVSRTEMEDLVARKVVEVISCRSEIGDLRAKCDKYEEMNDKWKRKTQALQKMCHDLNTVIKRYIIDVKNQKDNPTPIKITRSVGLQVCADQRRRLPVPHQPQQNQTHQGPSNPTKPATLQKTPSAEQRRAIGNSGAQSSDSNKILPIPNSKPVSSVTTSNNASGIIPKPVHSVNIQIGTHSNMANNALQKVNNSQVNQSSDSNKLINQTGNVSTPGMVTISPSKKGYLSSQTVITPTASSIVTGAITSTPNNLPVRSSVSQTALSNTHNVVATNSTINDRSKLNINTSQANNITTSSTPNTSGLVNATAASNKVIDVVDLSDEEDSVTPTPQVATQPKQTTAPAPKHQQGNNPSRPINNSFQSQHLPQHKPHQAINRIHAPGNLSRSIHNGPSQNSSSSNNSNGGGIRPMVFANQMANGVNVHRPPPLVGQGIGAMQYNRTTPISHPAPLPDMPNPQPHAPSWKKLPPRPTLKISRLKSGIVLSWNMDVIPTEHAAVSSYQIYAYQEGSAAVQSGLWKKVGDVKALPLPMACTLTQFTKGNKYHFAVRAQDVHTRVGTYSEPQSIALT